MAANASQTHRNYFDQAARVAQQSLCLRRRCGTVIVSEHEIIGSGYNAPPGDDITARRCELAIDKYKKYPTDKTCCIHAEQRAILDALRHYPDKLKGSLLYFASINESGKLLDATQPYCTICSKMALDVGVEYFLLYSKDETQKYHTKRYNQLSFASQKYG